MYAIDPAQQLVITSKIKYYMNISKYRKLTLIVPFTLMLGLGACEKDFEELNKNPNVAEVATPSFVLTNALESTIDRQFGVEASMDGGDIIVQHMAKIQYPDEDAYFFRTGTYQNIWNGFYAQGLEDFNLISKLGVEQKNPNYQAVGLIMRAYTFSLLTDIYGDIPYSDALRAKEGVLQPKYDKQQDVYKGILGELKQATTLIDPSGSAISGDILFDGDMTHWLKFANSLRLRLAMRIVDADPATADPIIKEVLASPATLFQSNADNAQLQYGTAAPNNNPINENRKTRDDHRVSTTLVSKLTALKDPRLAIYAEKPEAGGDYVGVPNGIDAETANGLGLSKTSRLGNYFTRADAPGVLMTYAEVLFFRAEAIARGLVAGNAATTYTSAIRASMEQFGITDNAAITAYLAQPAVVYNAANYKQSIGNQKWIALFQQGLEAWSEYRRLDYPNDLKPGPEAALAKLPTRFIYPGNEQSVNLANYKAAVANQGADNLTTKLWWDKF
ncbi:SusD/RagB family nutrient-binding outer membrane lipoprotein [Hymenobacter sp. HDW8]|uniref:SusD/RagB family nutrient-binding outer membrane lipoprotein n=1 Tax=Hymenobacter sp. HDW8 TaxID=2714932 RepID=UPI001F0D971E|nr:SusD/RagB family nutrient-binding outer membrane lipoprotein [Hymenobacter sp. HDW8]